MKQFQSSLGTIIKINMDQLFATALAIAAYFTWPTSIKWYGFGFLSICCGLAGIAVFIRAIRMMLSLYARDKAMAEYLAQGDKPKASSLAGNDALDDAGMR